MLLGSQISSATLPNCLILGTSSKPSVFDTPVPNWRESSVVYGGVGRMRSDTSSTQYSVWHIGSIWKKLAVIITSPFYRGRSPDLPEVTVVTAESAVLVTSHNPFESLSLELQNEGVGQSPFLGTSSFTCRHSADWYPRAWELIHLLMCLPYSLEMTSYPAVVNRQQTRQQRGRFWDRYIYTHTHILKCHMP